MNKTALITGATTGIGLELARIHAANGGNLVLVARNKSKLDALKTELEAFYQVTVHTIDKDLSEANAAQDVYAETSRLHIEVDYLINNAGFGDFGFFAETDWDKESRMIQLNITTLTHLTKLYLRQMQQRGVGRIMNVASTAAFQPGPTMAVYFATKAYVLSFTEAVSNEVKGSGISITTLCPGPTETGFSAAGSMDGSRLFRNKQLPTGKDVAQFGYRAMLAGKTLAVHGIKNNIMTNAIRFIPRSWVVAVSRRMLDHA
jgi:short-subunit dehydrogenase